MWIAKKLIKELTKNKIPTWSEWFLRVLVVINTVVQYAFARVSVIRVNFALFHRKCLLLRGGPRKILRNRATHRIISGTKGTTLVSLESCIRVWFDSGSENRMTSLELSKLLSSVVLHDIAGLLDVHILKKFSSSNNLRPAWRLLSIVLSVTDGFPLLRLGFHGCLDFPA